jgi:aquaporin Z
VVTMAYAVGHISGAHFNPAITIGVAVAKRFEWKDVPAYVITQVAGGLLAGLALFVIANGRPGFKATGNMAANGYAEHSPGKYSLVAVFIAEVLLTAVFLYVILGATDTRAPQGFAPIAIGLVLTLIHLVSIPISNTSVNPARSTGVAFFNGNGAVGQLWLFWLAPIIGAAIAGATFHLITGVDRRDRDISGEIDPEDRPETA